jgi:protein-S-isoprenylcysteine O-methyltransferase Ste14
MIGKILVFIQFSIIFLMILPITKIIENLYIGLVIVFIALLIGILAIKENNFNNFNITPYIKNNSKLITNGIYKYIRHPMYSSVLLGMFGIVILYFDTLDFILYIILFINMIIKMYYEEYLWNNKTLTYQKYSKKTKRLIPFIF